jgi:hypothetical protein
MARKVFGKAYHRSLATGTGEWRERRFYEEG